MQNSYSQSGYMSSNQRLSGCPSNGSLNQCTSMNGAMSHSMNGSMQCGPLQHPMNGLMGNNPNIVHHEINSFNGPSSLKNASNINQQQSMSMNYPSNNVRMRANGYNATTASQQSIVSTAKHRPVSHQYQMNTVNVSYNNTPSNSMQSSYGPQNQGHFNANQVSEQIVLICF